mmetsp:Transcript_23198/g.54798  ORF Transcript_23198/g.54798 Transcript_23198/m.54798 type:complete len:339 (+) Transcript_23198:3232-4248(+)
MDALVRDDAARRRAALAGRAVGAEQDAAHGQLQVGAGRHDDGVVATQLQQAAAEARGHARAHGAAHAGRAGGTDQRHAGVVHQGLAHVGAADDQLGQAVRCGMAGGAVGLHGALEQGLRGQRGQRCLLGWLPHAAVTSHQSQGRVPGPHGHREVEGRDDADDAQRQPLLHHAVAGALAGDRQAVQLARQADRELADVDHFLDFAQAFARDLAGLDGHQLRELGLVGAQLLAEQAHELAALRRGHDAPGLEGLMRAADGGLHVGGAGRGELREHAAVDGRAHAQVAGGGQVDAEGVQHGVGLLLHGRHLRKSTRPGGFAGRPSRSGWRGSPAGPPVPGG